MSKPSKETQDKKEVSNFYDMIIKIDSFRNLKKKESGHFGWDIIYGKDFNYQEKTKEELVKIGVLGNGNRGKSFILSKLSHFDIPSSFSIKTEGLSIKFPDLKNKDGKGIVLIDSAGFEVPLQETNDFKLEQITGLSQKEANEKINTLTKDRAILEAFTQQYILQTADVLIAVVGQLTYSEQQLLLRMKRDNESSKKKKKKIFVVHNLFNLVTKDQVQDYINNVLMKSLTFKLEKTDISNFDGNTETVDKNYSYYHEECGNDNDNKNDKNNVIEHLIMAKDDSEAGKYYNETTIKFLLSNIVTCAKLSKYPVKSSIKNFLYDMSGVIFENAINKPEKGEPGYIFDELIIGDQKIPKFYIDNYPKDIILKSISIDSLGFSSFFGKKIQPNCCVYIVDNINKLPYKEFQPPSKNDEKLYYLVIQIELPGILNDKDIKPTIIPSDGKYLITLEGERKIRKIIDNPSQNEPTIFDYYNSSIKEGFFSFTQVIDPENIILNEPIKPAFQINDNGILTFCYLGSSSETNEEIEI